MLYVCINSIKNMEGLCMAPLLVGLCVGSVTLGAGAGYLSRNLKEKMRMEAAQKRIKARNEKVKTMNTLRRVGE